MTTKAEGQLIMLDEARQRLAKVSSVDEAKSIRDKAEALRHYAKQQGMGLEAQNRAAEIKIRAERRAGEILSEIERDPGGRPPKNSAQGGPSFEVLTPYQSALKKAEVSPTTGKRWQAEASIPEPIFEAFVATAKESNAELTSAATLAFAKSNSPDIHRDIAKSVAQDPSVRWEKALGELTDLLRAMGPLSKKLDHKTKARTAGTLARIAASLAAIVEEMV